MKKRILTALLPLALLPAAHAAIEISLVGDGSGYDITGTEMAGWRSTDVTKTFDADGDAVYGTEGLFFGGSSTSGNNPGGGQGFSISTKVGAGWASFAAGADFTGIAQGYAYGTIDDPTAAISGTVADWSIKSGGFNTGFLNLTATPGLDNSWFELLKFTIDENAPEQFRIGLFGENFNSTWNAAEYRISADGGSYTTVTGLDTTPTKTSMVFFDVNLNGATSGTFSIGARDELGGSGSSPGTSLGGVTFDVIPEPGNFGAIAGVFALSVCLVRRRARRD